MDPTPAKPAFPPFGSLLCALLLLQAACTPVAPSGTVYTRIGDVLGWISLAGFVFFMVFQAVVEGRAKKAVKGK
jgi:hypothetical protein